MSNKIMNGILIALVVLGCSLAVFAPAVAQQDAGPAVVAEAPVAPAPAAEVSPPSDELSLAMSIIQNARAGNWWGAFGALLLLSVVAARWAVGRFKGMADIVKTDAGGTAFTFLISVLGMLGTAVWARMAGDDVSLGWSDLKAALLFGVVAAGGWSVLYKRFAKPLIGKITG